CIYYVNIKNISGDSMKNSEAIIIKLYNFYKFIEPEFLKFKKLPCFNDVKDLKDGLKKINNYIAQEVDEKGFIDTFENVVSKSDIYNAFDVFYVMCKENHCDINEDDIITLAENKEYQLYYDAFIKQYFIKSAKDLDKRDINNELLKRVLVVRLNSPNRKEKGPRKHSTEIKKKEEQKEIVEERRVAGNMSNENKYNIIAYKSIDADHDLIDKAIAELPEKEQKLIERKGRISLGIFDKLLTPLEEKNLNSILNKIRSKLGLKIIPQENNERKETKKEKTKPRKKGEKRMAQTIYELVNIDQEECDRLIGYLSEEEKSIIEKRNNGEELTPKERNKYFGIVNKLRRWVKNESLVEYNYKQSIYKMIKADKEKISSVIENDLSKNQQLLVQKREDILSGKSDEKLTNAETDRFNALVYKIKVKLGINKVPKTKPRRKENPQQTGKKRTTIYSQLGKSKEETDALIEKLSDDDKRIVNDRLEGKKQSKEDLNRYFTIINAFRENKIPSGKRRKKSINKKITPQELKEELSEKEKENINKVGNMSKPSIDKKVQNDELIQEQSKKIIKEESNKEFENNYKTLLSIAMKDPRITRKIDPIDLSIACFRYGIGKSERPRDINAIAKFYEITPEEVEEISTRILKELYDVLVDGIIDSNAKQYVKIANQNN
ncbi:MAG: hypothetical protein K6G37_02805, partial [Bacilli bacterium]|nr:hypothetical protein [Bacilli bacterium]